MACFSGPEIVNDGLVLHLDAANSRSYPGSGTTWVDLSGNGNNGTLANGPIYSDTDNGSIFFDGVNDRITLNTTQYTTIEPWTILFFAKFNDLTKHTHLTGVPTQDIGGWAPLSHYGAGLEDYKQAWWDSNGWRYSITSLVEGQWHQVGLQYDGNNSVTFILDGNFDNSSDGSTSFNPIARLGSLGYRQHLNDRYFNGYISNCLLYNRALPESEIKQNFEALRGRYGL